MRSRGAPTRRGLLIFSVLLSAGIVAAATTYEQQRSPANQPWPPGVQKVSDQSPVLAPAEALKTFYMAPGYHLELVAAEPLVQDPILMDWDPDGRLWVLEMPGFVRTLDVPEPNLDPIGRVVVLQDTNNDGTMDKRTVFADGLVLARALKVLDHGVLVGEPPNVLLLRDTNGDWVSDRKDVVVEGYGRREARVEQNANGLFWSLDNRMYTADSDIDITLKDGKFEARKTLSRGEWGATFDDAGRVYRNTNESAVHVDLVPTAYFARNPTLLRTRGSYEAIEDETGNIVWPVRPNPGTNRAYQSGIDREDGSLARFTSVCAPMVYRGDRLPAETYGNVFVAEPAANLVSRMVVKDDGTTLKASKAYERGEFLASTDERFRPVYLSNAPDGTLYIVDMYRGVIQQRADITEYLHAQIKSRKLEEGIGLGRIYRVMHDTTRRNPKPAMSSATPAQLATMLTNSNGWTRDTAQRLLVERGAVAAAPALTRLAETAADARTRLHALWTLDGIDRITPETIVKALGDANRDVRSSAIRISERWLADAKQPAVHAAVLKRLDDTDWAVRQQLAASIGTLPDGPRETAAVALLEKSANDPVVMDAALSGLRGREMAVLEKLLQGGNQPAPAAGDPRDTAITMLAGVIVRSAQDASIQKLMAWVAEPARPMWQRTALMRGAEVALLGAALPGAGGRRGGNAPVPGVPTGPPPCPTCPGGRAGPGGAYYFPQAAPAAGSNRGGGRGGGPALRLNREPASFSALAAAGGDLGTRATAVLARVEWPGKPGAAAPITPLSADEQRRFDAGSEVYKNVCQACHQADGRGQDKIAANLIGSVLALAPPDVPARILLNGKEGPIGLMPPVGQVFTDDQIANVLTYIRREWGQNGTPVDANTIKAVRSQVAGRARPWTNEELLALIPGGRGGHRP